MWALRTTCFLLAAPSLHAAYHMASLIMLLWAITVKYLMMPAIQELVQELQLRKERQPLCNIFKSMVMNASGGHCTGLQRNIG